jgi:hypothetical protein
MKRVLTALLIGGVLFAGIYGLAASLNVSSATLGAGNTAVASCQAGTLSVSYSSSYNAAATAGYRATTVTVGNIDATAAACGGGKDIKVTLSGPGVSNAQLAEQVSTVATGANPSSMSFSFAGVSASDITGVHVMITG